LLLLLTGCSRAPDIYAPPIQRQPLLGPEAHLGSIIAMNDPQADSYIVRDISRTTEQGAWRWAYKRPELRFYLRSTAHLKFVLDAGIPPASFKDTGLVTLSIRFNEREFDSVHFDHPGNQHYEKPVPAEYLRAGAENFVVLEPDKLWVSKEDGAKLGFVLVKAGFVK